MHTLEIEINGRVYEGSWRAGEYDRLSVTSSYGSTYAYIDKRDPEALARALLAELVRRSERRAG